MEIAQQAVSQAAAGNRSQLFLDPLQCAAQGRASGQSFIKVELSDVEGRRVQTGEPADRP